jgi:hypothetical protein
MKPNTWVGILLVVLGALALANQGFTYTHRERVMDVGSMHVTREDHDPVSIPPILGGLALVRGIALLAVEARKVLSWNYINAPPESRATHSPLMTQSC